MYGGAYVGVRGLCYARAPTTGARRRVDPVCGFAFAAAAA